MHKKGNAGSRIPANFWIYIVDQPPLLCLFFKVLKKIYESLLDVNFHKVVFIENIWNLPFQSPQAGLGLLVLGGGSRIYQPWCWATFGTSINCTFLWVGGGLFKTWLGVTSSFSRIVRLNNFVMVNFLTEWQS